MDESSGLPGQLESVVVVGWEGAEVGRRGEGWRREELGMEERELAV